MSYEEEDTGMSYEEEDTCMSYEEEDTCMSYEEEDTCLRWHERHAWHQEDLWPRGKIERQDVAVCAAGLPGVVF